MYLTRDIPAFVMYCVNGASRSTLIIESTDSMIYIYNYIYIIESVDSISRDEPDSPLTQYITNAGISRARYTIEHFKHHHRVLRLISNRMCVQHRYNSAIYAAPYEVNDHDLAFFFFLLLLLFPLIFLLLLSSIDLAR